MDEKPKKIKVQDALELMREHAGMSADGVSLRLGRARNWLRNVRGREPMLGVVASVGDVCGVDVALVSRETGETLAIVDVPDPTVHRRPGPYARP